MNRDIGKKSIWKQDYFCNRCGLSGHWAHTCRTLKHFANLFQASLKQNGKKVESHSNTIDEENVEENNAMATDNSNSLISIKGLHVSDFFEDPSGDIGYFITGGVISSDK